MKEALLSATRNADSYKKKLRRRDPKILTSILGSDEFRSMSQSLIFWIPVFHIEGKLKFPQSRLAPRLIAQSSSDACSPSPNRPSATKDRPRLEQKERESNNRPVPVVTFISTPPVFCNTFVRSITHEQNTILK